MNECDVCQEECGNECECGCNYCYNYSGDGWPPVSIPGSIEGWNAP